LWLQAENTALRELLEYVLDEGDAASVSTAENSGCVVGYLPNEEDEQFSGGQAGRSHAEESGYGQCAQIRKDVGTSVIDSDPGPSASVPPTLSAVLIR
jgi:hypothetical protein